MSSRDRICTIHVHKKQLGTFPGIQGWKQELETCQNKDSIRIKVLEEMLIWMGQGETEQVSKLLMSVIRFILPSEDNRIKKRLQLFWENCICTNDDGSLKEEMILVCDTLRKDLQSPNEFIRGSTCRMLCNINQMKILEPMLDAIRDNLTSRHPYVVRNAIMCIYSILRLDPDAMPGVIDDIESILHDTSDDPSTMRNAFLMLLELEPERAVSYAQEVQSYIADMGDLFQMQYLNLLKKLCDSEPEKLHEYLAIVANLIEIASSPAVLYEGATTILSLTRNQRSSKIAIGTLIALLESQGDANIKQVVINQLVDISNENNSIFEPYLLDLLRIIGSSSNAIRIPLSAIVTQMKSLSMVETVLNFTRKEVQKIHETKRLSEDDSRYLGILLMTNASLYPFYPRMLLDDIDILAAIFKDTKYANSVLEDCRVNKDTTDRSGINMFGLQRTIMFIIRDAVLSNRADFSPESVEKHLIEFIPHCRSSPVLRIVIWLIAHIGSNDVAKRVTEALYNVLSPFPIKLHAKENQEPQQPVTQQKHVNQISWKLRHCIMNCDDLLLSSLLASCLAKLSLLAVTGTNDVDTVEKATQIVTNIYLNLKNHTLIDKRSPSLYKCSAALRCIIATRNGDSAKAQSMLKQLVPTSSPLEDAATWKNIVSSQNEDSSIRRKREETANRIGQPLVFRQLLSSNMNTDTPQIKKTDGLTDLELGIYGASREDEDGNSFLLKLQEVHQMTGLGDPVYIEAFFTLDSFDITGEFLIINRTDKTIENLSLEISPGCDSMVFVNSPAPVTVAAQDSATVIVSLKAKSTETGLIFGYATYNTGTGSSACRRSLPLHDLHVDLLSGNRETDMIDDSTFRELWTLFEWENKIQVKSMSNDIQGFVDTIIKATKMSLLGDKILDIVSDSDLPFISQNLYCKTAFDEEALANVSLYKAPNSDVIDGHVRIRARKQGLALTIGDRVSSIQKVR